MSYKRNYKKFQGYIEKISLSMWLQAYFMFNYGCVLYEMDLEQREEKALGRFMLQK